MLKKHRFENEINYLEKSSINMDMPKNITKNFKKK